MTESHQEWQTPNWETEVLEQWNDPSLAFPAIPPADWGYARARLTVFRSLTEWLTIFEIVGFDSEANSCLNQVVVFGNNIKRSLRQFSELVLSPLRSTPSYPDFNEDADGNILIHPLEFAVELRGYPQQFSFLETDYDRLGIDLTKRTSGQIDAAVKVLRLLTYIVPEQVFIPNEVLLDRFGKPSNWVPFLQIYNWYHPDYRRHGRPSDSPCLRSLARAIARNNPSEYTCPPAFSNIHWSYWPEWPR